MKIIDKILDDYFTYKLLYKIKENLWAYDIEIIMTECKIKKNRYVYIEINRNGRGKLAEARSIGRINKSESINLLNNAKFFENIKKEVEVTLEMMSKGL